MNMCPSNKRKLPPELCLKGQVFFICSNYQSIEIVKDKISLLGGKVDVFLTKNVTTVLVEDTHLCAPQLIPNDLTLNTAYAPNAVILSNFQYQSGFSNLPSTSRGFNLLASSPANSPYRIIGYARQCGIQVLGIYHFLALIDQQVKSVIYLKKKTLDNVSNLSGCFIKFESCLKKYRPCYKMFNNDPERLMPLKNAKLLVKPDTCNVILEKPIPTKQHFNHMDTNDRRTHRVNNNDCNANAPVKGAEKKAQAVNKAKPKEENNYCECCKVHFSDLKQHIKSAKHQNFVSNEKNYESVHSILKMLPSAQEFIEKHQTPEINAAAVFSNSERLVQDNSPETASAIDYSIPLNLHIKKTPDDNAVLPLNLHITKQDVSIPMNLHAKQIEEAAMPLNLHIKKEFDLEKDELIKKEIPEADEMNPFYHNEATSAQQKALPLNDDLLVTVKLNNKDEVISSEMPNADTANLDPLFDKTNTAALAQLCLKNFDSYWLDNIPCEMDDLMFDDNIFDIDDTKLKASNEQTDGLGSVMQDSPSTTEIQTPAMVSGISNVCLKSSTNTSLFFNEEISIKNEPDPLCEGYQSSCKPENSAKCASPPNLSGTYNEAPIDVKKIKVEKEDIDFKSSMSTFYSDKAHMDAIPSCSTSKPLKMDEQMFSSDSSDDENGSVLISNVLNRITYSDDAKDKDSCNEDSDDSKKSIEVGDVQDEVCPKPSDAATAIAATKLKASPSNEELPESKALSPYNELPKSKGQVAHGLISKSKDHESHNAISGTNNRTSHDSASNSKVHTPYNRFSEEKVNVTSGEFAGSKLYAPYKQLSQSKTEAPFDPMSKSEEHASCSQLIESKKHMPTDKPSKPKYQFASNGKSKVESVYQFSETDTYGSEHQQPKSKSKIVSDRLIELERSTFYDPVSGPKVDTSCSAQSRSKSPVSLSQASESKDQACHKDLSKSKVQTAFNQSAEPNIYESHVLPPKLKGNAPYDHPSDYRNHAPYNQIPEAKVQSTYNAPIDPKVHLPYNQLPKSRIKSSHDHFPGSKVSMPYITQADSKLLASCDRLQKPKVCASPEQPVELRAYPPSEKVEPKMHPHYDHASKKEARATYCQQTESKLRIIKDHIPTSKASLDLSCDARDSTSYDPLSKLESRIPYNHQFESKVCSTFDPLSSAKAKISRNQLPEYKNHPPYTIVPAAKMDMYDESINSVIHASYNQVAESKIQPNFSLPVDMKVQTPYDHLPKAKAKSLYNQLSDSKNSTPYDRHSKSVAQPIYDEPIKSKIHAPYQPSNLKAISPHGKFAKVAMQESYQASNTKVCAPYDMMNDSKYCTPQEQQFKIRPKSSYEKFPISNAHSSYEVHHSKHTSSYDQPFESKFQSSLDQLSRSKLHSSFDLPVRSKEYDHFSESKDRVPFDRELKIHPPYAGAQVSNSFDYKMTSPNLIERYRNVHPKKSMSYTVENMSKSSVSSSESAVSQVAETASQLVSPVLSSSSFTTETTPHIISPHFNSHAPTSIPPSEVLPVHEKSASRAVKTDSNAAASSRINSGTPVSAAASNAAGVCNAKTIAHRTETVAHAKAEAAAAVKSVHTEQSLTASQPTVPVRTVNPATSANSSSKPKAFPKKERALKFKPLPPDERVMLPQQSNSFAETATVPPISLKSKKLRRKKSMKRLRKLPPLWSVSIMPGTGVRLKFSCSHPEAIESEDCESDFSD